MQDSKVIVIKRKIRPKRHDVVLPGRMVRMVVRPGVVLVEKGIRFEAGETFLTTQERAELLLGRADIVEEPTTPDNAMITSGQFQTRA